VVVTAVVYSPVRHNPFIDYDDQDYVVHNPHVLSGLSWENVVWSFTTTKQDNWHPLTWLSHALDCELFGADAGAHHIVSLGFHIANVLLHFLLLEAVTGWRGRSLMVAGLFALHPFNVDSVAWISERKNLLSTFFFLLSLGAYGYYARKPNWRRYSLLTFLFLLGLLAKPMLVTLPFVLMLMDYWPLQRIADWSPPAEHFPVPQRCAKQLLIEKLPFLAMSGLSSVVTIIAQQNAMQPLQIMPFSARLENALASYFLYIWKMLWPSGFSVHYPNPFSPLATGSGGASGWAALIAGAVLLPAVSWIAWRQRSVRSYLIVGWLWYLGTMVPVIGIVQVGLQGMADRYAYIPLIGLFIIVSWGAAEIADHFQMRSTWRRLAAAIVLTALSFLTVRQVGYWSSSYDLWLHALAVTQNNVRADDHVGYQMTLRHRPDEALAYYEEAARIDSSDTDSHLAVAANRQDTGRLHEAIENYKIVVRESTDSQQLVFCYVNLCEVFGELGDFSRAHEAFSRAWRMSPEMTDAKVRELSDMVSTLPSDEGYLRLGLLLEQTGRTEQARVAYNQALKLNPARTEARRALDHLLTSTPEMH
jgi:tetratricopeptide (TPR) repeat protein